MSLTKEARDHLSPSDFAVPGKRKLPIHDEVHVRMAQSQLDRTQGLTAEEKRIARQRILRKACALGIDVTEWVRLAAVDLGLESFEVDDEPELETSLGEPLKPTGESISALRFEAAALEIPADDGHINKLPFSGVLTRVDCESDGAPNGSGGRKVIVTKQAAEAAKGSLIHMGVNLTSDLAGHNPKNKIGVITAASVEGDAIKVSGHIYKSDFPEEARLIKARKADLGFSFEADSIFVERADAAILRITACVFTGASILLKEKAAYRSTSLAASAVQDIENMTPEELTAIVQAAMKPLSERLEKIEAGSIQNPGKVEANAALVEQVKPHAERIQDCANAVHADGLGGGTYGATAYILGIGQDLAAQAAEGTSPQIHRDHDWPLMASSASTRLPSNIQAHLLAAVEPHAQELEGAADDLEKAGFGKHPNDGHAAHLRHVAHTMRAHAARGKVPHFGRGPSGLSAARSAAPAIDAAAVEAAVTKAVDAATKPLLEEISVLKTKVADTTAAAFQASEAPARKTSRDLPTIPPRLTDLAAKQGIALPGAEEGIPVGVLDNLLTTARVETNQRMMIKAAAARSGYLK